MAYRKNMSIFNFSDKPTYELYLTTLADAFLDKATDNEKDFFHREVQYFLEDIFYMRARIENFKEILPVARKIYGDFDAYSERKNDFDKLVEHQKDEFLDQLQYFYGDSAVEKIAPFIDFDADDELSNVLKMYADEIFSAKTSEQFEKAIFIPINGLFYLYDYYSLLFKVFGKPVVQMILDPSNDIRSSYRYNVAGLKKAIAKNEALFGPSQHEECEYNFLLKLATS